jgi:multimeric flavodoxin WrbA
MSKKILVISSSPRKNGNSEMLCDQFIKGALEGNNEAEKICLCEKKIGYCRGCDVCQSNGGHCGIRDDAAEILDKMVRADVIVLASPIYYYSMCGQMKALLDRTTARINEIEGKDFYYIMTSHDGRRSAMDVAVEEFRGYVYKSLTDCHERGIIYGTGTYAKGEVDGTAAMDDAYVMGKAVGCVAKTV